MKLPTPAGSDILTRYHALSHLICFSRKSTNQQYAIDPCRLGDSNSLPRAATPGVVGMKVGGRRRILVPPRFGWVDDEVHRYATGLYCRSVLCAAEWPAVCYVNQVLPLQYGWIEDEVTLNPNTGPALSTGEPSPRDVWCAAAAGGPPHGAAAVGSIPCQGADRGRSR